MKKMLLIPLIIPLMAFLVYSVGCLPADPLPATLFTRSVLPGSGQTHNIQPSDSFTVGSEDLPYDAGYFEEIFTQNINISGYPPIALSGDGLIFQQKTMPIQVLRIQTTGKPTRVTRGIFQGFSLPIWNGAANVNEELYSCQCVPAKWDAGSDLYIYVGGWLDTANIDKNFQLRLSYENWAVTDVVPTTSTDVDVQTDTGNAAQYTAFKVRFTLADSSINSGDALGLRLRRIAATADEIAGEFVVEGMVLVYRIDKLGGETP